MPSTKRRTYTQETMAAIAQRFDAAPPASQTRMELGAPALVRALLPKLRQMTEKGYSWPAIASMMADSGVALSPNVLRKYAAAKPDNAKTKKRTRAAGALSSRARAVQAPAAATDAITAPDDVWDDIEPVEDTDSAPADSILAASTSEPVKLAAPGRSSSFRTRSDAESR
jgi:hypothetical protein